MNPSGCTTSDARVHACALGAGVGGATDRGGAGGAEPGVGGATDRGGAGGAEPGVGCSVVPHAATARHAIAASASRATARAAPGWCGCGRVLRMATSLTDGHPTIARIDGRCPEGRRPGAVAARPAGRLRRRGVTRHAIVRTSPHAGGSPWARSGRVRCAGTSTPSGRSCSTPACAPTGSAARRSGPEAAATRLNLRGACSTARERIQAGRVSSRSLRLARPKCRPILDRPGRTGRRAR